MIDEIVIQTVDPTRREEYIRDFGKTLKEANFPCSHRITMFSGVEDPSRVIVIVEWDSVEACAASRHTRPQPHARGRL